MTYERVLGRSYLCSHGGLICTKECPLELQTVVPGAWLGRLPSYWWAWKPSTTLADVAACGIWLEERLAYEEVRGLPMCDPHARLLLARHKDALPEELAMLAGDEYVLVAEAAVYNLVTPADVIRQATRLPEFQGAAWSRMVSRGISIKGRT